MRVVLVDPSPLGGICHQTYGLAAALAARGGLAVTLASSDPYELAAFPAPFTRLPAFKPSELQASQRRLAAGGPGRWEDFAAEPGYRAFMQYCETAPRSLVHFTWTFNAQVDSWLASSLADRGFRIVCTAHNAYPHEAGPPGGAAYGALYRRAHAVIAHSRSVAGELVRVCGVDPDRIHTLPLGNLFFLARETAMNDARRRLGLIPDAPQALFFGSFRPYKGIDRLISAFRACRRYLPQAYLVIAGPPLGDTRPLFEMTHDLGRACVVRPGYIPIDLVPLYFSGANLVVLPYAAASQSGITQMAYAHARPVIVTNVGGLAEDVLDGHTGVVVPADNTDALVSALCRMLAYPQWASQLGRNGARSAHERHSWEKIADAVAALYHSLEKES